MKRKSALKQYLLAGLIAILPASLTIYIIFAIFKMASKPGAKLVSYFLPVEPYPYLPELVGFIVTLVIILILGWFVRQVVGRRLMRWAEEFFVQIPIFSTIYSTIKQFMSTVTGHTADSFVKVVLIEYPKEKLWTYAMVTGESKNGTNEEFYHIFLPTTPNPTSGFLLFIRKSDVMETGLTVEEGLKAIISGGMLTKERNMICID